MRNRHNSFYLLAAITILLVTVVALYGDSATTAVAQDTAALAHPTFPLRDAAGNNVLDSGQPISTMNTCGTCHDTEFIAEHSFHADLGLADMSAPGEQAVGREWDTSPGNFGRWDPLTYRYLSPATDENIDLTTAEWVMRFTRHVGGGPAEYSRDGQRLDTLAPNADHPETSIVDPETGETRPWNWAESGVVEMNCFLCHIAEPNNEERIAQLEAGNFGWANTATLVGTGIITSTEAGAPPTWLPEAFDDNGRLQRNIVPIQDPSNQNCATCHGDIHQNLDDPLLVAGGADSGWSTRTTGQIISPQRISDSALNISDKADLSRSFDIHAERVVGCTDCHYALNNPIYTQESDVTRPEHLTFDPRRLDFDAFLYRPLHQFAKGSSAQSSLAPEFNDTIRRCESCHTADNDTHDWLPYAERHMQVMACETCHVPEVYGPAQQTIDWTAVRQDGSPLAEYRGVEGDPELPTSLITGYEPIYLQRTNGDGSSALAPHNLITAFYWVYGDPPRPVPQRDLLAAYLAEDSYRDDIMALFDSNNDNRLVDNELRLDSDEKVALISQNLVEQGLENPRIEGDVQPYSVNHTVTNGRFATKDCQTCHTEDSRVTRPLVLASYAPGGTTPTLLANDQVSFSGEVAVDDDGQLTYTPDTANLNLYVIGYDNVGIIDMFGAGLFVLTMLGVFAHGGLRVLAAKQNPPHEPQLKRVYMYSVYERFWHWLQTAAILLLLFTGLIIHKPDLFGIFSFPYMVQVHNVLGFLLLVNAALSLFYHLASGEIKQYLPRPVGFFDQAIQQTTFYLRGIFRNDPHPFDKTRDRKLNPLQQMTYFAILNVLLPLQIITGVLIWGVQVWPDVANALGGLRFLTPFHALIAWLFASFIVLHVYLTTTGHKPTAGIQAMMLGWDDVEVHDEAAHESSATDSAPPAPATPAEEIPQS